MQKVLQIVNYMYPHIGGIEQVARNIIYSLKDVDSIEQKIICFNENAEKEDYRCYRHETVSNIVDGVEVIRCGCAFKVASQSISFSFPLQLRKLMNSYNPDVVIFHYPNPYEAEWLLRFKDRKFKLIVFWNLDIIKQKRLARLFHSQTLQLCERADYLIASSPNYINGSQYLSRFREKCRIIPNCISTERMTDPEIIRNLIISIRDKYRGKTICFTVGRHVPYKGTEYLVRASRYLDDHFAVLIAGEGPLTPQLKQLANGDKKVEFLGVISDLELAAYDCACDIFCFPSITKNESFGFSMAEAMYYGKPTVTFTIPGSGVNYLSLNGVTGIESPNADAKAFAEAIMTLDSNPELRNQYGLAAKERIIKEFSFNVFKNLVLKSIN